MVQYLSMCGRAVSIGRAGVSVSALTILALGGIAVTVNPDNPVNAPELETIAGIYTGEITNWKDIGGNDLEIVLIGREAGSGTRDGFESITGTEDDCKYRQEHTSLQVFTVLRQQRLCITRALAVEPDVLLMDESTSALDPVSTSKLRNLQWS